MEEDKLNALQQELKDALKAIEFLTERLINLAVIENKFLEMTSQVNLQDIKCSGILHNIQIAEERINHNIRKNDFFFTFRYKWIQKLILKNRHLY